MTNAEKYRLSGIEAYNLSQELGEYLTIEKKAEGVFVSDINSFFVKATKPTLTEDEKAILRHLQGFYYIYRTTTGILEGNNQKHTWCGYELYFDDDVFQFIKERRRILNRGVAKMTYKEFSEWCNERACDGCWGPFEAKSCLHFINNIEDNCKGIFKARKKEKMFHELYEESASIIVNATNKRIEELLNANNE